MTRHASYEETSISVCLHVPASHDILDIASWAFKVTPSIPRLMALPTLVIPSPRSASDSVWLFWVAIFRTHVTQSSKMFSFGAMLVWSPRVVVGRALAIQMLSSNLLLGCTGWRPRDGGKILCTHAAAAAEAWTLSIPAPLPHAKSFQALELLPL